MPSPSGCASRQGLHSPGGVGAGRGINEGRRRRRPALVNEREDSERAKEKRERGGRYFYRRPRRPFVPGETKRRRAGVGAPSWAAAANGWPSEFSLATDRSRERLPRRRRSLRSFPASVRAAEPGRKRRDASLRTRARRGSARIATVGPAAKWARTQ